MSTFSVHAILAAGLTVYPVFGDSGNLTRQNAGNPQIEAIVDHGLIAELVVRCKNGAAIISYSKIEILYCAPDQTCDRNLRDVVARTCGR